MKIDTESEKNNPEFDIDACALREAQKNQAVNLRQLQTKTAHALEVHNDKDAEDLLNNDREIRESPAESRQHAATILAATQNEAAAMLKDSQSSAAKVLNDSQVKAAAALRVNQILANEKHDEKDEVISWLGGSYSATKPHEK